ncbi:shewanella-like protein phosphatase 2 [Phalaenopsis equestris]|uniref:shewanella-like protein phosphatase 2 n=1 Tax=Phalaenopsis equestris TaxID=78828 RepID=UPI0009E2E8D2|nr:shewanella-like protein phosphatase 2 [Phalaenopsis equestris]
MEESIPSALTCSNLPPQLSSFVNAFVDFCVSGLFFPNSKPNTLSNPIPVLSTHFPAPSRLVAIGDLHGDYPKSLQALALAGLIDPFSFRWTGGTTVAVQVGDVLDRGGDEIRLLYLLQRLKLDAAHAGGELLTILGNHEVMNIDGDFRYVTPEGLDEFKQWGRWFRVGLSMKRLCSDLEKPIDPFRGIPMSFPGVKREFWEGFRSRIAALRPDGVLSRRFLADNPTVAVVGDSVFVHGGLLQRHVEYGLERINEDARDWICGLNGRLSPKNMRGRDSVVWLRRFSEGFNCDCQHLEGVLSMIPGVRRMVMGHTIQEQGINAVCENRAIRIDVGLSKGCSNGLPEVLEINGGLNMRVITANSLYDYRGKVPEVREGERHGLALLLSESRLKEVEAAA